ncbi:hypothetical protein HanPSC8_Chr15g0675461 [Helianthus annuus]|nr:hypothetical protein HanPSC8_Chr15g0675461 [Helianthus annuus]
MLIEQLQSVGSCLRYVRVVVAAECGVVVVAGLVVVVFNIYLNGPLCYKFTQSVLIY